jgi:hypothetical protein
MVASSLLLETKYVMTEEHNKAPTTTATHVAVIRARSVESMFGQKSGTRGDFNGGASYDTACLVDGEHGHFFSGCA